MKIPDKCTDCGCLYFIVLCAFLDWTFVIHCNAISDVSLNDCKGPR